MQPDGTRHGASAPQNFRTDPAAADPPPLPGQADPAQSRGQADRPESPGQADPARYPGQAEQHQFPGQADPALFPGGADARPVWPTAPVPVRAPRPPHRTLVLVIAGVVVAAAAVVSVLILGGRKGDQFPVGSCLTAQGTRAVAAACDKPGAYKVTKVASSRAKCPDPSGPAVELQGAAGDRFRCLSPAR